MKMFTAAQIAAQFDLRLEGQGDTPITGVAPLEHAGPSQLSFLANPRYRAQLRTSRAGTVIVRPNDRDAVQGTALITAEPYTAFAKVAHLFAAKPQPKPGIHASAIIDPTAIIDPSAEIGPHVTIGPQSVIAAGCIIGSGSIIGESCTLNAGCVLIARVTLVTRVTLGCRVVIHPGAVLSADGFGLAMESGHWLKVPQLGGVVVGDDCEIGCNTCIDRGSLHNTILENDVRVDNLVQIAHNCHIGAHTALAGCVGIAGSAKIGRYCMLGGQVGVVGHIAICDRVTITGRSVVRHSIHTPGVYSSGTPLTDHLTWQKNTVRFKQLNQLARHIKASRKEKE